MRLVDKGEEMVIDDKVLTGVDPEKDYDDYFPYISHVDSGRFSRLKLSSPMDKPNMNFYYKRPHHRMHVYTNVYGLKAFYSRDGIILPVEYNSYLTKIIEGKPDAKGIVIIRYYTIYIDNKADLEALQFVYKYKSLHLPEDVRKEISEILDKQSHFRSGYIDIRLVDFIDEKLLREANVLEYRKLNMYFSNNIEALSEFLLDDIQTEGGKLLLDANGKVVIEIGLESNDITHKRFVNILGEVIPLVSKKTDTSKDFITIKTYTNGYLSKEKHVYVDDEKEDLFKHVYKDAISSLTEETILNTLKAECLDNLNLLTTRVESLVSIRELLVKNETLFIKLMDSLARHELSLRQLEKAEFRDILDVFKTLKGIF